MPKPHGPSSFDKAARDFFDPKTAQVVKRQAGKALKRMVGKVKGQVTNTVTLNGVEFSAGDLTVREFQEAAAVAVTKSHEVTMTLRPLICTIELTEPRTVTWHPSLEELFRKLLAENRKRPVGDV